jgi:hypothetical protein
MIFRRPCECLKWHLLTGDDAFHCFVFIHTALRNSKMNSFVIGRCNTGQTIGEEDIIKKDIKFYDDVAWNIVFLRFRSCGWLVGYIFMANSLIKISRNLPFLCHVAIPRCLFITACVAVSRAYCFHWNKPVRFSKLCGFRIRVSSLLM